MGERAALKKKKSTNRDANLGRCLVLQRRRQMCVAQLYIFCSGIQDGHAKAPIYANENTGMRIRA